MISMRHSLEVFDGNKLIFASNAKWLHPLFELEAFLSNRSLDISSLTLKDKVAGKGAALLSVRLGIKNVQACTMSIPAKDAFEHFGICYEFDNLVERIDCKTEELLFSEFNVEKAYDLICRRIAS